MPICHTIVSAHLLTQKQSKRKPLTSQNTSIKSRKPMVQQLLSQVVIQSLLRAVPWFISWSRRPITPIETEGHRLAFRSAFGVLLRTLFRWVEESLIALHPDKWFGTSCKFCRRELTKVGMSMDDTCVSLTNAPRELRGLHRTTTLMLPSPSAMVKVEYKAGAPNQ